MENPVKPKPSEVEMYLYVKVVKYRAIVLFIPSVLLGLATQ